MSDPEKCVRVTTAESGEIVVLNRDLFFGVRIGNVLRGLGYRVSFVAATEAFVARLRSAEPPAALGIVDMGAGVDWGAIAAATGGDGVVTPILVFGSHLDVEGRRAAKAAGARRVVSNGDFHRDMVALVERYALRAGARPTDTVGESPGGSSGSERESSAGSE
jgi:hypothetical protein